MNFFKTFAASLLAVIVGSVLSGILMLFVVGAMMASSFGSMTTTHTPFVTDGTVLTIDISQPMADAPETFNFSMMAMGGMDFGGAKLLDVLNAIERAETDERIEGIYLYEGSLSQMSAAHAEELRSALTQFKESGKWVVAQSEIWSGQGYWIASVADEVFINPAGTMQWQGNAAQVLFFKGLIDKLGVEMQILRHGTFKSAVEPFMMDNMSEANREQMEKYVGSLWSVILEQVSESRGIEVEELQRYADELAIVFPEDAVRYGLADGVLYSDQVNNYMAALIDGTTNVDDEQQTQFDVFEKQDAPNFVSIDDYVYNNIGRETNRLSKNHIALIYINGDIIDGESAGSSVGSKTVVEQLRQARENENVRAVVIRVNSPGGSALASEVMWREIELLKEKVPVIVSMGEYAASGGYYVSAPADVIIADRTTLTGSIGVFGMLPNIQNALSDKLGITVDVVRTAKYADLGSPLRSMEEGEREYMQKTIERVYSTFVGHVAMGRHITPEMVDSIGQGRVWLGEDAKEIGLIDGFGGLKDAISLAADRANIADDYKVIEVTDMTDDMSLMMKMLLQSKIEVEVLGEDLDGILAEYAAIKGIVSTKGVQARLPFVIINNQ